MLRFFNQNDYFEQNRQSGVDVEITNKRYTYVYEHIVEEGETETEKMKMHNKNYSKNGQKKTVHKKKHTELKMKRSKEIRISS